jgi:hypothetical protein
MAYSAFTIKIFVLDGDPEGVRLIERVGWTGQGIVFPREKWPSIKQRAEFSRTGIYILRGYEEGEDDLPAIYVGEGDVIRNRIESHYQNKDFWDTAIVFTAMGGNLNKAHVKWLEYALVHRARQANRSKLENETEPQPPSLSEAELADTDAFFKSVLQLLPLMGLQAFEIGKIGETGGELSINHKDERDTVVVPAHPEHVQETFIGKNCWYAIHISWAMRQKIKYIAAYQTKPKQAVTHWAPVASIEPYGEKGKYKLNFAEAAKPIGPIPFADAPSGFMSGQKYTSLQRLLSAKKLTDLFPQFDAT